MSISTGSHSTSFSCIEYSQKVHSQHQISIFSTKGPLIPRRDLLFPVKQKTAHYSVSFLSPGRTGNVLFLSRNDLSDLVTVCSVPQETREDRDRTRLDSMVLLIMKLDQLDQDIENALSTASSPSSTPTNLRRHVPVSYLVLTLLPSGIASL